MQPAGVERLPTGCCSPQNAAYIGEVRLIRKRIIEKFFAGRCAGGIAGEIAV